MDSTQEMPSQENESLAGEVIQSLEGSNDADNTAETGNENHDPLYVQKRLKQQKRAHEKEVRELRSMINELQSQVSPRPDASQANQYDQNYSGGIDEQIHKAVGYALRQKEMEERRAKEEQDKAHVNRQYHDLDKHLDRIADKYDDFDDVVRGNDVPFTVAMRDASLLLPKNGAGSAGEVLYKLGKNPDELSRISKLHPLDQASELVKLSHALISGSEQKSNSSSPNKIMGQIKNNPITNTRDISEKTPISELRAKMKSGWK